MPHAPTLPVPWPRDLGQTRLRELLREAGCSGLAVDTVVEVEGHFWCGRAFCDCPRHPILGHFQPVNPDPQRRSTGEPPTCAACGGSQTPHPFYTYRRVPARQLASHVDRPLAEIGAVCPGAVRLRCGKESRLFYRALADGDNATRTQ
jgi:hypothetical protein